MLETPFQVTNGGVRVGNQETGQTLAAFAKLASPVCVQLRPRCQRSGLAAPGPGSPAREHWQAAT
eukprot:1219912-Rhodomonas_salina.2